MPVSQDLGNDIGKVLRIDPATGAASAGNPFTDGSPARNLVPAATATCRARRWTPRPAGTVEHGPQGGDELNQPQPGRNYGWPIISYGENYDGNPIGKGLTAAKGMEQPVYYWDRSSPPAA